MRVVALTCSNTEIVCALGCAGLLVGVDDHSDYPEEVVARLPRVGPDLGIDIERVRQLEPDLVLASLTVPGHEKVVEGLERAGLDYLAPEPVSLEDVYRDIRDIGARLGVAGRAETLASRMRNAMTATDTPAEERPGVLVQWWPKPVIAPGRLSWVNDMILAAGARNPLGERHVKSEPLTDEQVRELDPDAIVISWCGVKPQKYRPEVVYRKEAYHGMRAIRDRRVSCIPEAHLGRPSPRLLEGLEDLRRLTEGLRRSRLRGSGPV